MIYDTERRKYTVLREAQECTVTNAPAALGAIAKSLRTVPVQKGCRCNGRKLLNQRCRDSRSMPVKRLKSMDQQLLVPTTMGDEVFVGRVVPKTNNLNEC